MEEKFTLKAKMRIIKRSLKLVNEADAGHTLRAFLRLLPAQISRFAGIYLASLVIDGITAAKPLSYLLSAAAFVCGVDLFVYLLRNLIDARENCHAFRYRSNTERILGRKVMGIDYTLVEDIKTANQLENAQRWITNEDMGVPGLEGSAIFTLSGLFSVVVSAALLVPILFREGGNEGGFSGFVQSGWGVAAMLALLILIAAFQSFVLEQKRARVFGEYMEREDVLQASRMAGTFRGFALFNYRNGKEIRLYKEAPLIMEKYKDGIEYTAKVMAESARRANRVECAIRLLELLTQLLLYGFAIVRAVEGMMSPGEVVAFVMYFTQLQEGFIEFAANLSSIFTKTEFCRKVFDFLDVPDQKYMGTIPTEKRDDDAYEFEFCHVSFRYPNSEEFVLKDICLKWRIGEKMALVGKNGSGKSTLVKLLCRLYDPTQGVIKLNGIDIRKYKYEEYMALFSVVFQDSALFSFPLAENVAADTEYDAERVKDCVKRAGLAERLSRMEDGIDTCLYKDFDERGVEISGGEAQKLCLARAVYKGAPFIILDEPTAALDPVSEYDIYTKFNRIVGTKTAIYISHRLSSCRFCDEITVMEEGRVVQRGSHEELVAKGGVYKELWQTQAEYYKGSAAKLFG